ncbi:MAG: hypothetical protein A2287_06430 [Candidatus Melainabacteria bacterium RIFOXYA12_FULL_32_12]|nr:MAG: hypothetical protein A2104_09425 [Candidatus Melainabacteria bacterium GWF2_32_7]OGI21966.1 MAG: hypothetical protein A2255_06910 [Candidatus Melainabacteria bacterium RIFOXYA2_FULL_32_9]OGI31584.1 MAG: hypothetical protein A2287_06430 [Candidatus Melainabacteria bacterium RIFOXYA12_FULL_32_12]
MANSTNTANNIPEFADNFFSFFRIFYYYLVRARIFETAYTNFVNSVKNMLTANQKLRIAKYRVNHLRYRLNQMERIIDQNTPMEHISGDILNQLR